MYYYGDRVTTMFEMINRLVALTPELIVIGIIGSMGYYLDRRLGPSAHTPEDRVANWTAELKRHATKSILVAPCMEEVIFRAPLVVAFGTLSPVAWMMIVHGAALFGLMHVNVLHPYLFTKLPETTLRARIQRALHVTQASVLGFTCGYFGVVFHSLLIPVAIHALWNTGTTFLQGILAASEFRRLHEGVELEEIPPGQGFYLHLQESIQQRVARTILYDSGFSNSIRPGSEFDLLSNVDGSARKFRVHKIVRTKSVVSVYAVAKAG